MALVLVSGPTIRDHALDVLLLGLLLAVSLRFDLGWIALLGLLIVGIDLRLVWVGAGATDVDEVTRAAIQLALAGGNPYGVGYEASVPPGAPFAYGPLALLWYLPFAEPARFELLVSIFILGLLALRGRPLGVALFATTPILLSLASDGSNDHSAGLLLLGALVTLERVPRLGAFVLGVAVAFKPYALAFVPGLLAWAGVTALLPLLAGAGLFWLSAAIAWGVGPILRSLQMAEAVHGSAYYSLAFALQRFGFQAPAELFNLFRLAAGALAAVVVLDVVRTHRGVVLGGAVVFLATLYLGFWSTFAYLAALAPVICWYLDDWLGFGRRIRWPLDPWGRLTDALDRRWPARPGGRQTHAGVESVSSAHSH